MNRRDFLLLRTEGRDRVFELSCERMYMHYVDARSATARGGEEAGLDSEAPWWSGEPPISTERSDAEALFRDLGGDLSNADVLRVLDREWLVDGDFRERFDALLASFRSCGGRVQFASGT